MKNMKWLQTEVQENKNNRDSFQNAVWQFVIVCWFVCSFVWKLRKGKWLEKSLDNSYTKSSDNTKRKILNYHYKTFSCVVKCIHMLL